jgi:membrane peptidoglycan carboxypeptidase
MYVNMTGFGTRSGVTVRGIGAAARVYFNKRPDQLTVSEAALLVQMIPAPARFSPDKNSRLARTRRDAVLRKLHEQGMLDAKALDRALKQPARVQPPLAKDVALGRYFADVVRRELKTGATMRPLDGVMR